MNKQFLSAIFLVLGVIGTSSVLASNPIIFDKGVSDPHVRVYGDKVYLYSGHDGSREAERWVMRKWQIYSTTNLVDWTLENYIEPTDNYIDDDSIECWAGDAATRNGKYYFYFSDRHRSLGVMVADDPTGPFKDPIGKPLVMKHDPTIFFDDDANQTPYIICGKKRDGGFQIVKLNDDMVSLAEEPKYIKIIGEAWEKEPDFMDKNYLFKRNGIYYLSWGTEYATSKNIYGPYTCQGRFGTGYKLGNLAHSSFFEWQGQFYHVWCYYLSGKYRTTVMSYCHFTDDGRVVTDTAFLDQHFAMGVGQYGSNWPKIEAEWYYGKSEGAHKQDCADGGFEMDGLGAGNHLLFTKVDTGLGKDKIIMRLANAGQATQLEIRADSLSGELLGTVQIPSTSGNYKMLSANLKMYQGMRDLYFVSAQDSAKDVKLDWFKFGPKKKKK